MQRLLAHVTQDHYTLEVEWKKNGYHHMGKLNIEPSNNSTTC
jgi:hypothetical protein